MNGKTRVVVTGIGVVSPLGIGRGTFWKNLTAGKSGISEITGFDTKEYRTHKAAEVKNFEPRKFMKDAGKKGRATQFLLAAVKMAIKDGGLDLPRLDPSGVGIIAGITAFEPRVLEETTHIRLSKGPEYVPPSLINKGTLDTSSTVVGYELGLKGANIIISTACAASNYAIGYGFDLLKQGRAKVLFCCGTDALSRVIFTGFNRLFAVSPDKCRPFDKNRRGMIMGEGAAVLALETLGGALERKADIYAEVLGYGLSCDAFSMTAPSKEGIKKVMEKAIRGSGIKKEDVDHINAHGTGTINNDRAEAAAIREVFGPIADGIHVSSIKSMIGHTLGAAGAMEAASCCLSIKNDIIPPTINFKTPDPECSINLAANKAKRRKVNIAVNNSFAFGGNNASVVFGKLT